MAQKTALATLLFCARAKLSAAVQRLRARNTREQQLADLRKDLRNRLLEKISAASRLKQRQTFHELEKTSSVSRDLNRK